MLHHRFQLPSLLLALLFGAVTGEQRFVQVIGRELECRAEHRASVHIAVTPQVTFQPAWVGEPAARAECGRAIPT